MTSSNRVESRELIVFSSGTLLNIAPGTSYAKVAGTGSSARDAMSMT